MKLDRPLAFKKHLTKNDHKIKARNNIPHKLKGTNWLGREYYALVCQIRRRCAI